MENDIFLSILTATYQRGEDLKSAYASILENTKYIKKIEWLIMDDGSTDDTKDIVESFKGNPYLDIRYFYQKNAGKQAAINKISSIARGTFCIDLDSDDVLAPNAVDIIRKNCFPLDEIYGFVFLKKDFSNRIMGRKFDNVGKNTTMFELFLLEDQTGELAICFNTKIRKQFIHRLENGEKFVTEARLYNEMDKNYDVFCFNEVLQYINYKEDGYTNNIQKVMQKYPYGYLEYFKQLLEFDFKGIPSKKMLYVVKHYILFCYITKTMPQLSNVYNWYTKILITLLYIPGIFAARQKGFKTVDEKDVIEVQVANDELHNYEYEDQYGQYEQYDQNDQHDQHNHTNTSYDNHYEHNIENSFANDFSHTQTNTNWQKYDDKYSNYTKKDSLKDIEKEYYMAKQAQKEQEKIEKVLEDDVEDEIQKQIIKENQELAASLAKQGDENISLSKDIPKEDFGYVELVKNTPSQEEMMQTSVTSKGFLEKYLTKDKASLPYELLEDLEKEEKQKSKKMQKKSFKDILDNIRMGIGSFFANIREKGLQSRKEKSSRRTRQRHENIQRQAIHEDQIPMLDEENVVSHMQEYKSSKPVEVKKQGNGFLAKTKDVCKDLSQKVFTNTKKGISKAKDFSKNKFETMKLERQQLKELEMQQWKHLENNNNILELYSQKSQGIDIEIPKENDPQPRKRIRNRFKD